MSFVVAPTTSCGTYLVPLNVTPLPQSAAVMGPVSPAPLPLLPTSYTVAPSSLSAFPNTNLVAVPNTSGPPSYSQVSCSDVTSPMTCHLTSLTPIATSLSPGSQSHNSSNNPNPHINTAMNSVLNPQEQVPTMPMPPRTTSSSSMTFAPGEILIRIKVEEALREAIKQAEKIGMSSVEFSSATYRADTNTVIVYYKEPKSSLVLKPSQEPSTNSPDGAAELDHSPEPPAAGGSSKKKAKHSRLESNFHKLKHRVKGREKCSVT